MARRTQLLAVVIASACGHHSFERVLTQTDGSIVTDDAGDTDAIGSDAAAVDPSLLVWFECDGLAGGTQLPDSSGNGFHGVCEQGQCPTFQAMAPRTSACVFNSLSTAVVVPARPEFQVPAFTTAVWMWPQMIPADTYRSAWVKHGPNGAVETWGIYARDNTGVDELIAGGDADGTYHYVSLGTVPLFTWTHVAVTYDGTAYRAYRDGSLAGEATGPLLDAMTPLLLGHESPNGVPTSRWSGLLDDARLYNRVLTAAEIAMLAAP